MGDRSRPWSVDEARERLAALDEELGETLLPIERLEREAARASAVADRLAAQRALMARHRPELKSESLRKAWVVDDDEMFEVRLAADLAQAKVRAQRDMVHGIRARMETHRTMVATARELGRP